MNKMEVNTITLTRGLLYKHVMERVITNSVKNAYYSSESLNTLSKPREKCLTA